VSNLQVPADAGSHNGLRKAAVFLVTLGPEASFDIFKHLRDDEVEALTTEIAGLEAIAPKEHDDVLSEFSQWISAGRWAALGGPRLKIELPSWSSDSLQPLHSVDRPTEAMQEELLRRVHHTAPERLHTLIRKAPSQTIALILAHIEPHDASMVLGNLSTATQSEVAERIAAMDRTAPDLVRSAGRMLDAAGPDA